MRYHARKCKFKNTPGTHLVFDLHRGGVPSYHDSLKLAKEEAARLNEECGSVASVIKLDNAGMAALTAAANAHARSQAKAA